MWGSLVNKQLLSSHHHTSSCPDGVTYWQIFRTSQKGSRKAKSAFISTGSGYTCWVVLKCLWVELQWKWSPSYTLRSYGNLPTVYLPTDNVPISSEPIPTARLTIDWLPSHRIISYNSSGMCSHHRLMLFPAIVWDVRQLECQQTPFWTIVRTSSIELGVHNQCGQRHHGQVVYLTYGDQGLTSLIWKSVNTLHTPCHLYRP